MKEVISSSNTKGTVNFTKSLLHSIAKISEISPMTLQVFLSICSYADDKGTLITDKRTLAHINQSESRKMDYCLRTLQEYGIITTKYVKILHQQDIFGKIHDKQNYYITNKQEWKVTGERYLTTLTVKGSYLRIYINPEIATFSNGYYNTLLLYIKNNLYYDTRVSDNAILEER